jgi:hypothetical protein
MIHDVSHRVFRYRHPGFRHHEQGHAKLEYEMAVHVITSGWAGDKPLIKKPPKPSSIEAKRIRLMRVYQLQREWETKETRASNKLAKLAREAHRLMTAIEDAGEIPPLKSR